MGLIVRNSAEAEEFKDAILLDGQVGLKFVEGPQVNFLVGKFGIDIDTVQPTGQRQGFAHDLLYRALEQLGRFGGQHTFHGSGILAAANPQAEGRGVGLEGGGHQTGHLREQVRQFGFLAGDLEGGDLRQVVGHQRVVRRQVRQYRLVNGAHLL